MSDNRDVIIYGVIDPVTNECRYVGKTVDLKNRIRKHLYTSRVQCVNHKDYWIRSVVNKGVDPIFIELEVVPKGVGWEEYERFWISYLKVLGARLCNHTSGGGGLSGHVQSEETKRRRALNWVGRKHSEESKRKMSETKIKAATHRGEDNQFSKFSEEKVKEVIESFFTSKLTRKGIAEVMGLSHASVIQMVSGKSWKHLDWFRELFNKE